MKKLADMKWEAKSKVARAATEARVGGGAPPAAAASVAAPELKTAVVSKWGKYEPDVYQYRIAPDGVPERKKK